jgi:hypothetical protein
MVFLQRYDWNQYSNGKYIYVQTKFCGWKKTQQKELINQSTWDENYTNRCVRLQHLHKTVCEIYKNVLANHTGR